MKLLAIASCAVMALATVHDAGAAGGRGGFSGSRAAAPAHFGAPHHFHGGGTRVFVGGTFFVGPRPYYYWPGYWPGYYYPPVVAAPVVAAPAYWYYCAPLAAYYPYVAECPAGWQLVEPHPY